MLLVGHTHLPGMRKVGDTYIVNPGSLGQPRNGIPDATYAVWRDGDLQIHHLHYDHDTTQRKLMSCRWTRTWWTGCRRFWRRDLPESSLTDRVH